MIILHLGEKPTLYSDGRGNPYVRPRYHYRVTASGGGRLEGFSASPETEVARMLLRAEKADPSTLIEVRRGERVTFPARPVGEWAALTAEENDKHSACFRPFQGFPA